MVVPSNDIKHRITQQTRAARQALAKLATTTPKDDGEAQRVADTIIAAGVDADTFSDIQQVQAEIAELEAQGADADKLKHDAAEARLALQQCEDKNRKLAAERAATLAEHDQKAKGAEAAAERAHNAKCKAARLRYEHREMLGLDDVDLDQVTPTFNGEATSAMHLIDLEAERVEVDSATRGMVYADRLRRYQRAYTALVEDYGREVQRDVRTNWLRNAFSGRLFRPESAPPEPQRPALTWSRVLTWEAEHSDKVAKDDHDRASKRREIDPHAEPAAPRSTMEAD